MQTDIRTNFLTCVVYLQFQDRRDLTVSMHAYTRARTLPSPLPITHTSYIPPVGFARAPDVNRRIQETSAKT